MCDVTRGMEARDGEEHNKLWGYNFSASNDLRELLQD